MAVGIKVGNIVDEIGTSDFLYAFFSTVSGRLEAKWGECFPSLMELYKGSLPFQQATMALSELVEIQSELATFPPDQIIWDIDDHTKVPPWEAISQRISPALQTTS